MANVWKFDSMPESYLRTSRILTESNVQTFIICLVFIVYLAIKNKQMKNVWNFDTMPESLSYRKTSGILTESNVQTFTICLFFIAQWAVKSWIVANPIEFSYP